MNILQALREVFAEPKVEDMVAHYVLSAIESPDAILLVTDPEMQSVYTHLASKLRCVTTGDTLNIEANLEETIQKEVIVVHRTYDAVLLKRVAMRAKHVILVVEYFDTSKRFSEQLEEIKIEFGCKIDMAFIEEGVGERVPYSPTESHYLGRKIKRMVKECLA